MKVSVMICPSAETVTHTSRKRSTASSKTDDDLERVSRTDENVGLSAARHHGEDLMTDDIAVQISRDRGVASITTRILADEIE